MSTTRNANVEALFGRLRETEAWSIAAGTATVTHTYGLDLDANNCPVASALGFDGFCNKQCPCELDGSCDLT
jgi:hypothetical protein